MKRNPVIPYALIAVVGILTVIVISFVGINQREAIQEEGEGGGEQTEEQGGGEESGGEGGGGEGAATADAEAIYESNCMSCHGSDLSGGAGPSLQTVGSKYSAEEIADIAVNGTGSMPPGMATQQEAEALGQWLAENYQ